MTLSGEKTPTNPPLPKDATGTLMFTDIMNNLSNVYPKTQLADISTSYGFICLLHLANEKGLVIENVDGWENLTVKRDLEALVGEGDI
jgi:condensin complex subunit 2